MIEQEYLDVMNAIRSKMKFNKAIWTNTSSDSQFRLALNSSTIVIDQWITHKLGEMVRFDIINSNRDIICRKMFVKDIDSDDFNILSTFYSEVSSYYKRMTQQDLKQLLIEINDSNVIGNLDKEVK